MERKFSNQFKSAELNFILLFKIFRQISNFYFFNEYVAKIYTQIL